MQVTKLSAADFESEVLQAQTPVVVDFYADWCPPCQRLAPVLEQLAGEYQGRVKILKVNTESEPELASALKIRSLPTLMFFDQGQLAGAQLGFQPKERLSAILDNLLSA